jgi:ABC-type sugar transport system substrate-binding protein
MKRLTTGLLTLVLVSWAAGCQRGNQPSSDKPTVALVLKTLNNPFFIDM